MASLWEMQAELRQQELLEAGARNRVSASTSRRRAVRVFNLAMPQLRRFRKR